MTLPPPEDQEKLDIQWNNMRTVARNCRLQRKKLGITQFELALSASIQPWQISRIEGDKYYFVRYQTLCLIARALELTISDLCRFDLFDYD